VNNEQIATVSQSLIDELRTGGDESPAASDSVLLGHCRSEGVDVTALRDTLFALYAAAQEAACTTVGTNP
jgi:hypothetical protein